jgi:hypothetical protein
MQDLANFIEDGITEAKKRGYRNHSGWRQMTAKYDLVEAVQRLVCSSRDTSGYATMVLKGLQDHTLEAAVLRFPRYFDERTKAAAAKRLGRQHA